MSRPLATLKGVKKFILKNDPNEKEDNESFKAQVVLLCSTFVGANIKKLSKFTGYSRDVISKFSKNLTKNGIWANGKVVYGEWTDQKTGYIAFLVHSCVAMGNVYVKSVEKKA